MFFSSNSPPSAFNTPSFYTKKRPRRCLNLQGHSKLQYRYEKSPCNLILQLIHTPFVKPVHNIFIFFLILFFFALRGLLSEKPAAYVLIFYEHTIYCVPNINFICIKCFFLSLKNILFILISFLIYNIYVGLSIILDTIIKKFDRRKPFEGTHRTIVCST